MSLYALMNDDCHLYMVKALDKTSAIKKFLKWQDLECLKNDFSKFPEEFIRDESNWTLETSVNIIE